MTSIKVGSGNTVYDSRDNCNAIIKTSTNTLIAGCNKTIIPISVISISRAAFSGCSGLTSVTIPNSVTSIEAVAFYLCSSLSSVISEIKDPFAFGSSAFSSIASNCTLTVPYGTKDAYIAKGWTEDVFKGGIIEAPAPSPNIVFADDKVKSICIANWDTNNDGELSEAEAAAVTSLGTVFIDTPFGDTISSFNELQYFTNLKSISNGAFDGCCGLASVTIPNSVTSIGKEAFYGCYSLNTVTIPNSVTFIGDNAFEGCSNLTSLTIGNSVTSIGVNAFARCNSLTSIQVRNGNVKYDSRDNCNAIIESSTNRLIVGCKITKIPNSVTSIGSSAYWGCSELTSITIPNSVTEIGNKAFYYCTSLTSITIPSNVISIGNYAFFYCSKLTSVVSEIKVPFAFGSYAFSHIASNCTLTVPYGTKDAYIAAGWTEEIFKGGIVEAPDPRASQSIALASLPSMTYGDATYTLPSKTNEGLDLIWKSSATSVATISGNILTVKGAGSATITATQVGNDDYKPFSKGFTLTVAKAPLTITAQSYTIKQGEAMPTFAATYTGFKNNETPAALTIRPTMTCSTTSSDTPGTYDITPSRASSANYKISYMKGTLTVLYNAAVDNTLAIENAEVSKGGKVVLPVKLNNTESITALQFEVALPAGVTLSKCQLTDRKGDDHTASYSKLSNGNYQVTVLSMSKAVFSGTEGAVVNLTLDVDKDATAGANPISITNIELTTAATQAIIPADFTAILTIYNVKAGDTNGDGKVSITDAVAIVGYILGENIDGFVVAAADANGDGNVNIFDVTKVINIILGEDYAESKMRGMMAMNEIGTMQTVANDNGTSLMVDNAERYIAMQFDVVVAAGQSVEDVTLNSTADHLLFYQQTEKNRYRVLACSMQNTSFEPTEEALVDLKQAKGAKIENAMFVTTDGRCVNMTVAEETTGIETAEVEKSSDAIYNLSGQYMGTDVNALPNGTYIRNQKKFVIK